MTKDQIKYMVDRFLWWRLPEHFNPDCGIHFDADAAKKMNPINRRYEPVGTNLFDATQADAMVRHMLEGLPEQEQGEVFVCSNQACDAVWAADPRGHCPKCVQPNGAGWSTMGRRVRPLPTSAQQS